MARTPCRFLVLAIFAAAGCQEPPAPVAVKGRVLYRDWPLTHGLIVFSPDSSRGSSGPMARAEIQAGFYNLRDQSGQTVPAGYYRVTVAAIEADGIGPGRSLLPDKYRDPRLSGLVCEIKGGQENQIDFNLQ
jgi:hypothetical protein